MNVRFLGIRPIDDLWVFFEAGIMFCKIIATKSMTICSKLIKIRICFIFDVNIKVSHDNNTFIFANGFVNLSKKHIYIRIVWGLYTLKIAHLMFLSIISDHIISLLKIHVLSNDL